ncbi:heterokaryon incompatibility protein-domain-containing protein [Pisolithus marmoratus]|nr:heterokaryon incompatibility protein-domain-containing protein [Pisolithus marmoratus]
MKLLNVEVVLDREKDIQRAEYEYDVLNELDDETTSYAILSHRWGVEVTYKEMSGLMKMEERKRGEVRKRYGYQKIIKSCEQAMKDGHKWLWIDTCCIDKRSSSELSEAINSMYRWYQNAQVCYALLSDVDESAIPTRRDYRKFGQSNGWPEWFMRGWTLQELIAPRQVKFFNKDWVLLGDKWHLAPALEDITGIPCAVLRHGLTGTRLSVARIISWAANRKTTRVEDRAYSLMGLFGVNMPMLYGEGNKAFQRLQLEIIRTSNDHSIFAWYPRMPQRGSVLAEDPSDFRHCGNIRKVEPHEFVGRLMDFIERNRLGSPWYTQRNSLKISASPIHQCRLAWLRWRARTLSQRFSTFTVSNAGIQVCLPVIPLPDSPSQFRAILPCTYGLGLVTIDLVSSGSRFDRILRIATILKTYPEFKTVYLAHHQGINEKGCELTLTLDDKHASYLGFTRRATYPRKFVGDTVTLSSVRDIMDDLIVIVYANDEARSCFAVGLGYYFDQGWVHVVCDGHFPPQQADWADFAEHAHRQMWKARAEHAWHMAKPEHAYLTCKDYFVKHAHLPRSIWAARIVWGRWDADRREADNFRVVVDVEECPGCCNGPCGWMTTSNDCGGLGSTGAYEHSFFFILIASGWVASHF